MGIVQNHTRQEMMVVAASRELKDGEVVMVGIGLPVIASLLAQRTHAPNLVAVFESGVIGARPSRVALTMGDPALASGCTMVVDFFETFAFFLQRGLIDVGFLGAAQVDRFGNINSTVIGDYGKPTVRLPGSGGACEIASCAKRVIIMMPHERRRLVEKVDFVTGIGHDEGNTSRESLGVQGKGPVSVITTFGILNFDMNGEMYLRSIHPGVSLAAVMENTGWDLKTAGKVVVTAQPTDKEIQILRELDHAGVFLGRAI